MGVFEIRQGAFEGPLSLLVDLLRQKKMEISEIHLADIADDFLRYMESHEIPPIELADFLVVASQLIYLKSRELFPNVAVDMEMDGVSLEERLRLFEQFVEVSRVIGELFASERYFVKRKRVVMAREVVFSGAENLSGAELDLAFKGLVKRLKPFFALHEVSLEKVKSVQERMRELGEAVKKGSAFSFEAVIAEAKHKADVVVSFLAVLELVRRQVILAKQADRGIILSKYEA